MARRVRCAYSGEYGNSEQFYKAEDGKYYQNEYYYQIFLTEKQEKIILKEAKQKEKEAEIQAKKDEEKRKKKEAKKLRDSKTDKERLDKSILLSGIIEILSLPPNSFTPPYLIKKVNEIEKVYNVRYILGTFQKYKNNIKNGMRDGFATTQRINYVITVIKNNIGSTYAEMKREERAKELLEAKSESNNNITYDIDEVFNNKAIDNNKTDFSKWLED